MPCLRRNGIRAIRPTETFDKKSDMEVSGMKVKFTADALKEEIGENLAHVRIKVELERDEESSESYFLRVYAVPKSPFLRDVFGTPCVASISVESELDGIFEADVWDVWRAVKYGRQEAHDLDLKCRRLIKRLYELAVKKESKEGNA